MNIKNIRSLVINKHLSIVRYFIVLIAIFFITFLFPKNNFRYDFNEGQPWKYEDLLAPFKFSIKKSTEKIEEEKANQLKDLKPFYKYDDGTVEKVKTQFSNIFTQDYDKFKADTSTVFSRKDSMRYLIIANSLLDSIYQKGIIALESQYEEQTIPNSIQTINLMVSENKLSTRKINDFYQDKVQTCGYVTGVLKAWMRADTLIHRRFLTKTLCTVIQENITYDKITTQKWVDHALSSIVPTQGVVLQGEKIIANGVIVNDIAYQKLQSLKDAYSNEQSESKSESFVEQHLTDIGHFLVTFITFMVFVAFMQIFARSSFKRLRDLTFILASIVVFLYLAKVIMDIKQTSIPNLSLYVLPFCVIPIIMKNFFGNFLAHYVHIVIVLLTGFLLPVGYEFLFLHFLAGLVAIISNVRTYYWSHFFISTAFIFLTYCAGYLGIAFIQESSLDTIEWSTYGWLIINSFFTLLVYPLIPLFEKIFGFISNITLVELSDVNRPLLKKLFQKAPGTFQHSMQVANLAEAAASEINANALLAKVGSLYHDIGKMHRPVYFIENQKTDLNPHDDLPYDESARIIIEHVIRGIEMAKRERLPNIITDFIRTHHGTTRTEYFYQRYLKQHPNQEVDEKLFRYPGPLPFSKETAIVMMADSVEAASKSLQNPSESDISRLENNIIDGKIQQNQFINCDLSFKDITAIKRVLKKKLKSIYHIRISYPQAN